MNKDLLWIKRHYSEKFSHLCRELFSTLLETEGLLPKILDENFDHSKFLYDDIVDNKLEDSFRNYIYSLDYEDDYEDLETVCEDPKVLMEKAGYDLYECKTEEDIQAFKKYYEPGEELCTFNGGRLKSCYVFFAVKKNVNEIKRKDFTKPKRQDLYGTSVISIQFAKSKKNNAISIKNRYNHTVNNSDSTFGNNLDNIIPGLRESFSKKYGFKLSKRACCNTNFEDEDYDEEEYEDWFEIPNYVEATDGKYYKYNYEIFNRLYQYTCYYCPNNVVLKNLEVTKYSNRYVIMDTFVFDLKEKKFLNENDDSFAKSITSCGNIEKINIVNDKCGNRKINLYIEKGKNPIIIKIDKFGRIIEYTNEYVKEIGDGFLCNNRTLEKINMPNVVEIGSSFLENNEALERIELLKVRIIYSGFLYNNKIIQEVFLPNVYRIYGDFLVCNQLLDKIELPSCTFVGDNVLAYNKSVKKVSLPYVSSIGDNFLCENEELEEFFCPRLETMGREVLSNVKSLKRLEVPSYLVPYFRCIMDSNCEVVVEDKPKQLVLGRI